MVLCWRRYGRAGGCRNPLKNKSKTLSYIKYHLKRCLYTLVFTSDPSSESFWSWMTDKSSVGRGKQSIPVETPRIAKRFLTVTCEASYMVPWKLNIENNLKYQYRACERSKDLKQRDRKMKGSNIPIIKTRDIRGHWVTSMEKQSNLRTTRSAEQRYAKQTRRE